MTIHNSYHVSDTSLELGTVNPAFVGETGEVERRRTVSSENGGIQQIGGDPEPPERAQWSNSMEFLMSCIAMSVGLGNVWRFPFTAYENGGGAFLIPYIIVLLVIGKPLYYLELAMGQFASRGGVKVWQMVPALSGLGYGQIYATVLTLTYYCALMALTVYYFVASFAAVLPWSECASDWGSDCVDSVPGNRTFIRTNTSISSSEYYFTEYLLHAKTNIDDGIGTPDWRLVLCLLFSWVAIFLVLYKGVKSAGKVAYFLAMFPYVVLIALLARGATLPGAGKGILFFITPHWDQLLSPKVWYAAVTQAFFSLGVSFGALVMYSSYNEFNHNVHRDAVIVTSMDTFTSLLAGCTIFAILGNLAHELGVSDISKVVKSGTGLAFISYPDAIAKFTFVPQLFAVLFFLMLFTLGIGSAVGLAGGVITVICDQFPKLKNLHVTGATCIFGFLVGLVYVTPGGQWILGLVDNYGVTFVVFVLATVEMIGVAWIYGMDNFCRDIEFMIGQKVSVYWRICWAIITPLLLFIILVYSLATMEVYKHEGKYFPQSAYVVGWILLVSGVIQLPASIIYRFIQNRNYGWKEMIYKSFQPSTQWGPKNRKLKEEWMKMKEEWQREDEMNNSNFFKRLLQKVTGFR